MRIIDITSWIFNADNSTGVTEAKNNNCCSRQDFNEAIQERGKTILIVSAAMAVWLLTVCLLWP